MHQSLFDYVLNSEIRDLVVDFGDYNINNPITNPINALERIISSLKQLTFGDNNAPELNFYFDDLADGLLELYQSEFPRDSNVKVFSMPLFSYDNRLKRVFRAYASLDVSEFNKVVVMVGNPQEADAVVLTHEIGHTLSLLHSFYEKGEREDFQFVFTESQTDNIMDYPTTGAEENSIKNVRNKVNFWKWQWEQMQNNSPYYQIEETQ